ncbi:nucleotide disphospho-sugar-binding domain-containing protein [Mycolicibacterium mengxianglii]|uniref:nucleotide disphospho-sugar-binding domain-containing protein n=1 Tax=Mycolicibacterium mengxianglii TaxID=2736649 RepID=UPI0018D13761|nr:nucleotide disphospho-sugar-binding domain-containing protein [Mycolicibacterium mengxianglii]
MAVVLAYTSPAIGHLFPFCALLDELAARGHQIHVRTLDSGVKLCRSRGFVAQPVDPRLELLQSADWTTGSALRVADKTVDVLVRRAAFEVSDFNAAVDQVAPHLILVDANCWGAISAAETGRTPWLIFSPFIPYLQGPGSPPFGPGYTPGAGLVGLIRDAGVKSVTSTIFDRPFRNGLNPVRARLQLAPVRSADALLRRAPGVLVATGKPFEYRHTDWGESVHLIGPANFEPPAPPPHWLDDIDRPLVLVTTSSVRQADAALVHTAIRALEGEDVHVVATAPAGTVHLEPGSHRHATLTEFVPHSAVLERAVVVVAHGGMGITQKALSRGIPVCAVPFGRDQFEVARRVEVARCGTRLPARKLNARRLRERVLSAMHMTEGARAVARGFAETGGMAHGADIVESHLSASSARRSA